MDLLYSITGFSISFFVIIFERTNKPTMMLNQPEMKTQVIK